MIRSGNPALRANTFANVPSYGASTTMTIQGTVNKTFVLLALTVFTACYSWTHLQNVMPLAMGGAIGGFIVAIITVFKKQWAGITEPLYALLEGLFLGAISAIFERQYPGIVIQAVTLTFGTLFCLLFAYKSKMIKATENFKLGVAAATGAIFMIYLVNMIMRFFGTEMPFIHESGTVGILFSLFVVVIAALNLVMDFDFIEKGADIGAPKYMEWYGAFGLMVTLIWLYLEILRLLAKTRSRR